MNSAIACYGIDESKSGILEAGNLEIWEIRDLGISHSTPSPLHYKEDHM